jgi:3-deoxy-manno-octulosonate cytidylyltransferase (CMP-KDO synthetase)
VTPTTTAAVAIIPVRLGSQRLPGKALLDDTGRPLFLHTWARATRATRFDRVYVATDSDEIASAAAAAGAEVIPTSDRPRTGSERCAEAAAKLKRADLVVDIQADYPEIEPRDLDALVDCLASGAAPTATLCTPIEDPEKIADPNVVKVVRGLDGDALYFSRSPIPYARSGSPPLLRHVGIYGFTARTLARVPGLPSSGLAETEGLEQLRFLENGIRMRVLDATGVPWGIETTADYRAFVQRVASKDQTA